MLTIRSLYFCLFPLSPKLEPGPHYGPSFEQPNGPAAKNGPQGPPRLPLARRLQLPIFQKDPLLLSLCSQTRPEYDRMENARSKTGRLELSDRSCASRIDEGKTSTGIFAKDALVWKPELENIPNRISQKIREPSDRIFAAQMGVGKRQRQFCKGYPFFCCRLLNIPPAPELGLGYCFRRLLIGCSFQSVRAPHTP